MRLETNPKRRLYDWLGDFIEISLELGDGNLNLPIAMGKGQIVLPGDIIKAIDKRGLSLSDGFKSYIEYDGQHGRTLLELVEGTEPHTVKLKVKE